MNSADRFDPVSKRVIGLAIEVHRTLGPGLLESVYEACLCHELQQNAVSYQRQLSLPVTYKGITLECGLRPDVIVEKSLLLEIKSVEKLLPVHAAQILTYLKISGLTAGLLINFNTAVLRDGLRRFVL